MREFGNVDVVGGGGVREEFGWVVEDDYDDEVEDSGGGSGRGSERV